MELSIDNPGWMDIEACFITLFVTSSGVLPFPYSVHEQISRVYYCRQVIHLYFIHEYIQRIMIFYVPQLLYLECLGRLYPQTC